MSTRKGPLASLEIMLCFGAAMALSLMLASPAKPAPDVAQQLETQLHDHVLTLRRFFTDQTVRFLPDGTPLTQGEEASWTLFGELRVEHVSVKDTTLVLEGKRIFVQFDQGRQQELIKSKVPVEVHIEFQTPPDLSGADDALAHIFLRTGESLDDALPDYWHSKPTADLKANKVGHGISCAATAFHTGP